METYRWAPSRKYVRSNREGLSRTKYTLQGRGQGIQDISLSETPGKHYGDDDEDDDDDDEESEDEFPENPGNEKIFVVFNSNLNNLFKRCQERGDVVIEQKRKTVGSMLSVELVCQSGCKMTWESQPVVKRKPLGNLLLAASILFTGNNFCCHKSSGIMF